MATISNSTRNTLITGTSDADSIVNSAPGVTINAANGEDTVNNTGYNVTVGGGAGNDSIYNYGDSVSINGSSGNDSIYNYYSSYTTIDGGEGHDSIWNDTSDHASINVGKGNDYIWNGGSSSVTMNVGDGNDFIHSDMSQNSSINAGDGDDTIANICSGNATIDAGAGDDSISNAGYDHAIIDAGTGDDTIKIDTADSASVNGGAGNDYIINYSDYSGGPKGDGGDYSTLGGGKGNDTIINVLYMGGRRGGNQIRFTYKEGDGNDLIQGFNKTSTLQIGDGTGTYSKETVDNDIVVTVGEGSVTLEGAANLSKVNIEGVESGGGGEPVNPLIIVGTEKADSIINTLAGATIQALGGADSVWNYGDSVSIDGGKGNNTIYNKGKDATISASDGNDYIYNRGVWEDDGYSHPDIAPHRASILGGKGNDTIISDGDLVTIWGGNGDDSVNTTYHGGGCGDVYVYTGGNDTVYGGDLITVVLNGVSLNSSVKTYYDGYSITTLNLNNGKILDVYLGFDDIPIIVSSLDDVPKINVVVNNEKDLVSVTGLNQEGTIDYINNSGNKVTITGDKSNYYITNWNSSPLKVNTGTGNDTVIVDCDGADRSTIFTGAGNDFVRTRNSNHLIDVGDGNDTVWNKKHDTTIIGGAGDDLIDNWSDGSDYWGENTNVSINAGNGNDTIRLSGITKNSTVYAGNGNDRVEVGHAGSGHKIFLEDGNDVAYINEEYSSNNFVDGGAGYDNFINSSNNNTINGGKGNDFIRNNDGKNLLVTYTEGDGNDVIYGFNATSTLSIAGGSYTTQQSGSDIIVTVGENKITLVGAGGSSAVNIVGVNGGGGESVKPLNIVGTEGADNITNTLNGATIQALGGRDTITNSGDFVNIYGGGSNDLITHTGRGGVIWGGLGNDTFYVTAGMSVVFNYNDGDGKDIIHGFEGSALIIGDGDGTYSTQPSGDDVIVKVGKGSVTLKDAAQLDYLNIWGIDKTVTVPTALNIDNTVNNTLITGTELDDTIVNGGRNVTIDALAGHDSISNSGDYVSVNGSDGDDSIANSGKYVTINTGNGDHYVELAEDSSKQTVLAQDGDDTIKILGQQAFIDSKGGDDYIVNGGNKVTINAGAGNDTVIGSQGAGVTVNGVTVNGGAGNDLIFGSGGNTMATIIDTENEDILEGGSGNDLLSGLAGRDKIDGNGGNDTLIGGKGNDTLTGGDGNDVFVYGTGNSTALNDFTYVDGDGNDVITDYAEGDRISVVGEGVVDSVYASGNDVIFKVGNGQITVKDAKDLVITYYDANGEKTFPQPDVVFSSNGKTATLLENYSGDSFNIADYTEYNGKDYSDSVQTIDASAVTHDISITGNKLKNSIIGSTGNDTLIGGKANDTLTGGEGSDTFVYNPDDGTDLIEDYQNEDVIKVNGTVSKITQTQTGNVILWIGSSKIISVKGGADHVVTYVDDTGSHTYPEVVKVEGTSVSLLSAYIDDTFDVNTNSYVADDNPEKIKTIDASVVEHDLAITGNKLANKILGGEGNDSIAGGAGNDNLTGNGGADVFVYSAGKDTITDYNAADGDVIQIDGTVTKIAESGDDIVFTVGSTKKTITVKDGLSQLITYVDDSGEPKTYPYVPQVVIDGKKITLTEYYAADTFDIADYGSNLQTIDASAVQHSVAITANSLANNITGSAEDDIIDGGAGKDKIDGGDGNDILIGGKGNDTLTGGDGDNVFIFETGEGNNVITDFKNTDTILVTSGTASAVGWSASDNGNVVMTVGTTKVTLQDAAGKYIHVVDSDGGESWYPDPPPDPVTYDAKTKTAILTEGYFSDTFVLSDYKEFADIRNIDATAVTHDISIVGDANKNSIVGSSQNDFINGAAGNDTVDGGEGDDTIQGGKGTDKLTGGDGADVFVWNSGDGNDIITDFTAEDTLQIAGATIDTAKITTKGDDLIIPVGKNNITLKGAADTRVVIDNGGEEPIIINDVSLVEIDGKTSKTIKLTEYYPYDNFDVADYGSKLQTIDASAVQHSVAISANSLANNITGSAEDDIIDGGAGKDKINGGDGNDTIIGGEGNDTLTGGDGADVFFYNPGDDNDVITDYQNEDTIYVNGTVSKVTESGNNLVLTVGSQKITVQDASDKRVTYIDDTGEHHIPDVPDVIIEGKKITLTEYYPSDTFDVADYGKNLQTIDASAVQHSVAITANTLANNITGSAEDDIIDGGAGKDKIDGGDGNDTIIGGKANDTLAGGDGADVFVYNKGDGNDVITDFKAEDMIQIAGATLSFHSVSGKDMILTVGSNKITLKGAADTRIVIDDDGEEPKVINDVPPVVIEGKKITLTEYYADDTFNVADYDSKLQTIDASAVQHSIAITANSLANSIVGTDDDDIIDAGKGKDKIFGGGGADVFIYNSGDGNDTIEDYAEEDIIHVMSGSPTFKKSGENVIMTVGSNKVTLTGAKDKVITWINADGETNYYPKLPVSVKGTAVTLLDVYSADTFDLATNNYIDDDDRDAIKTIDATAVEHDIAIVANKQANKITGGAGNDTFTGGTGNDTIDGGDGADVFVYNTGDGNDVIQNYTEEDRLFFADTKIDTMNVSVSGNDVVFTVGGGKVTVKDAKDKVIAYSDIDGEEVVDHSYPEIIRFSADGETATLLDGYNKETFDIADYPAYAASVRTINASAVKQDIAITANANKNTIVGSSSNDSINGMAGQDVLYGSEGNDTLNGGTGNDTLYGGEGNDTFEYKKGDGNDVIADYQEGEAIRITDITGVYCENKGDDVVMRVGSNTITIRNANTDGNAFTPITFYDGSGQHSYIPRVDGSNDLLVDDNYSATAALSSIVEPVKADYTPYDFEGGFDLVKQPAFAPATAYSDKK